MGVMLHGRERIVIMVEQLLPFQIGSGFPKSLGVGGKILPTNKEDVAISLFNTALQIVADIAGRGRDYLRSNIEIAFKRSLTTWLDVECREFQDHVSTE